MREIKNNLNASEVSKSKLFGKSMELGKNLGLDDTIYLLSLLEDSPRMHKDIASKLSLSQPSLSRRLKILQALNIIKKEPFRSKRRETHTYNLTIRGERLIKFINSYEDEITLPSSQLKIIKDE
jgi:DNA-binding HxlR family transcriptional regulator